MKCVPILVDTREMLQNTIVPDGIIAKVKGSKEFKIGNGINTYSELALPEMLVTQKQFFTENVTSSQYQILLDKLQTYLILVT